MTVKRFSRRFGIELNESLNANRAQFIDKLELIDETSQISRYRLVGIYKAVAFREKKLKNWHFPVTEKQVRIDLSAAATSASLKFPLMQSTRSCHVVKQNHRQVMFEAGIHGASTRLTFSCVFARSWLHVHINPAAKLAFAE